MSWNGSKIKSRTKELGLTLLKVAEKLEVTRQTVNKWIGGQVPRGQHLVSLCRILDTKPDYFFSPVADSLISVPQHRTVRKKRETLEMKNASYELAEQYLNLFRQAPSPIMIPVVRIKERNNENAQKLAEQLRFIAKIPQGKPFDFKFAFKLLYELGIYAIFRSFPDSFKKNIYAFYSKICDQRVVFINSDTNILDLIFQLLHETVHAIRDEQTTLVYDEEEENFCDLVANYTQFPGEYVTNVSLCIDGCGPGMIINKLKDVSSKNAHSIFGICARLKAIGKYPNISIGGADTNLKRGFHTIEEILFENNDPRQYIKMLKELSPLFINLISKQLPDCSEKKFAEWLGLGTSIDAKAVMEELQRAKE